MNKRRKFISGGILLSLVGLTMRGVSLALGAYISRTVGAEGVGLNALVMNAYAFALTFATAGISLTVTALVASAIGEGSPEKISGVLRSAFLYAGVFGSLGTLLLASLSGAVGRHLLGDERAAPSLLILSFSLLPSALTSVISGYFIGKRRVALNASVQIFGQAVRVLLTVILLVKLSGGDVGSGVAALAVGVTLTELSVFSFSFIEFLADRLMAGKVGRVKSELRAVAASAVPLAVSAYIRSALLTLEHSLIPKRLRLRGEDSSEALASYGYLHGMALPLLLYPMVPLSSFGSLLLPEFAEAKSRGEGTRMERIASLALSTALSYAALVAVFLFLFSEELGYAVYSSYDAGRFIAILAPVVPIMYLDHVADNMLKGIGEQVYSMWVNIIDATLSVVLVFVLIPIFGIAGYAIVIIAMEAFNFFFSAIRLRGKIKFRINLFSSLLLPTVLACSAALLSKLLFSECGRDASAVVAVSKIVFALCLYISLYLFYNFLKKRLEKRHTYSTASNMTISAKPKSNE